VSLCPNVWFPNTWAADCIEQGCACVVQLLFTYQSLRAGVNNRPYSSGQRHYKSWTRHSHCQILVPTQT
jgi:hypothetical protein